LGADSILAKNSSNGMDDSALNHLENAKSTIGPYALWASLKLIFH